MVVTIVREDVQANEEQRDCPTEGQKRRCRKINSRNPDAEGFHNCQGGISRER